MTSIREISPTTKLCGIIGNPVSHSMSPAIHNRAFEALGLDFVYVAFRVENVRAAVDGMRALENFRGLSVTIPHKRAVIEYLDEIDEVDRRIGSINTIVSEDGRLRGFGTDGPGARRALITNGVMLKNTDVLVLGSGGAARAIAFDLAFHTGPKSLTIMGVIPDELRNLARDLAQATDVPIASELVTEESLKRQVAKARVIIHATPIGMHPKENESVIPQALLHSDLAIMDIVYNPLETKLLQEARERGIQTISGLEMFVSQAAMQFEAWTGLPAPVAVMRQVVQESLG